jgi:hypothetical protein
VCTVHCTGVNYIRKCSKRTNSGQTMSICFKFESIFKGKSSRVTFQKPLIVKYHVLKLIILPPLLLHEWTGHSYIKIRKLGNVHTSISKNEAAKSGQLDPDLFYKIRHQRAGCFLLRSTIWWTRKGFLCRLADITL